MHKKTAEHSGPAAERMSEKTAVLLLDPALGINDPDIAVLVLKVLVSGAQIRPLRGLGAGAGLLHGAVHIDQIGHAVQFYGSEAQIPVRLLAQALDIEHIVLDSVVALSLIRAIGTEVPVLALAAVLVLDHLLAGSHDAVLAEVVVGRGSILIGDGLSAGLHLALGVEGVALGVDGKELQAAFSMVRLTVLKIEAVGFILVA